MARSWLQRSVDERQTVMETQHSSISEMMKDHSVRTKRPLRDAINVLVVDDEELVRKFVERVLREAGYRTAMASDGPEALAAATSGEPFQLLVTDMMMPQMNGDELARRLRQHDPAMKVLYLTGFSDRLFNEKVTLWEGEAFLEKPCSVKGLLEAVSLLLFDRVDTDQGVIS